MLQFFIGKTVSSGGTAHAVSSTIAGSTTTAAALARRVTASATLAGTTNTAAALGRRITVSGTLLASTAAAASLARRLPVSTTIASATTTSAELTQRVSAVATISGSTTTNAVLARQIPLTATIAISVTTSAALARRLASSVAIAGITTTAAALARNLPAYTGLTGVTSTSADLIAYVFKSATASGSVTTTSALSRRLSGTSSMAGSVTTASSELARRIALQSSPAGSVSTSAILTDRIHVGATISAGTSASATLARYIPAASSLTSSITAFAALARRMPLSSTIDTTVTTTAELAAQLLISATASGSATTAGSLRVAFMPSATLAGVTTTIATLDVCGGGSIDRPLMSVAQPTPGGDEYPLVDPTVDVQFLLNDLNLTYADDAGQYLMPFRIRWLYGFGDEPYLPSLPITPAHDQDILIEDAAGEIVFDSLEAEEFTTRAWGADRQVLRWRYGRNILTVVAYTPGGEFNGCSEYLEPTRSQLEARTLTPLPRQLLSVQVGLTTVANAPLRFRNGFNTVLTPSRSPATRRVTVVDFSAAAGSGYGRYGANCEEIDNAIKTINKVSPDDKGDIGLTAEGCTKVSRPVVSATADATDTTPQEITIRDHALQISEDCGACVTCDDYIAVYELERRLADRMTEVNEKLLTARNRLIDVVNRFQNQKECHLNTPARLILQPLYGNRIGVGFGFCNSLQTPVRNVLLIISFAYTDINGCKRPDGANLVANTTAPAPTVVPNATFRTGNSLGAPTLRTLYGSLHGKQPPSPYQLGGSWPHYYARFDCIGQGDLGSVQFFLDFAGSTSSDIVEAVVDAYDATDTPIPPSGSPLTDYTLGSGPSGSALARRLITCPVWASTPISP